MRPSLLAASLALAQLVSPVAQAAAPAPAPFTSRTLATLGDTVVLAFDVPAFEQLPADQKLLAYWLAEAAAAGDPIAWDQSYRHNLPLVRTLRAILTHPQLVPPGILDRVRTFARLLYLSHGLHDAATGRKIPPPFTAAELHQAALAAQATGADFQLGRGVRLDTALRALEGPLFDPAVDPLRTDKAPAPGADPLRTSAVNFYLGLSRGDLAGFNERFPLNSRLVKVDDEVREEVWRAGHGPNGRGKGTGQNLYADRLGRAVAALDEARKLATGSQSQALKSLADFLRTGDPDTLRASDRAWVQKASPVEVVLGFIETSADPRGRKGLFEGLVAIEDVERTRALATLVQAAGWLEAQAPIAAEYHRQKLTPPTAGVYLPLASSGDARPLEVSGVNLPNEQAELERSGSKSLLFPAIDEAVAAVRGDALLREFAPPEVAEELLRCRPSLRFANVALEEIAGATDGQMSPRLAKGRRDPAQLLGGDADTLEEARGQLLAHWFAVDPHLRELGLIPDARCQALYPQWAVTELATLVAEVPEGSQLAEDPQRAAALLRSWLAEKGAMTERRDGSKRTFLAVPGKWRGAVGELLALLQDIKGKGDAARLQPLLRQRAGALDPSWRDEVLARLSRLGLPRRVAVVLPRIVATYEPDASKGKEAGKKGRKEAARQKGKRGRIASVHLEAPTDLDARILLDWESF